MKNVSTLFSSIHALYPYKSFCNILFFFSCNTTGGMLPFIYESQRNPIKTGSEGYQEKTTTPHHKGKKHHEHNNNRKAGD